MSRLALTHDVQLSHGIVLRINSDTGYTIAEETNSTKQYAVRTVVNGQHAIFEVTLRTARAVTSTDGVFQCALERRFYRSYTSSIVMMCGEKPPLPDLPRVVLTPCRKNNFDASKGQLRMTENEVNCFRCRAIGYPLPRVALYRQEDMTEVTQTPDIGVSKYVNVAEGAFVESSYTFYRVQRSFEGSYCCIATGKDEVTAQHCFIIRVMSQSSSSSSRMKTKKTF